MSKKATTGGNPRRQSTVNSGSGLTSAQRGTGTPPSAGTGGTQTDQYVIERNSKTGAYYDVTAKGTVHRLTSEQLAADRAAGATEISYTGAGAPNALDSAGLNTILQAHQRPTNPAPKPGGGSGSTAPAGPPPGPSPAQQSALDLLQSTLSQWGLSDLYSTAVGYLNQGYGEQEIELKLQQTPEYQQRFSGNAQRIANGYGALTPAQYIATEAQYRQVMQSYGLPKGFYDSQQSLAGFIGNDISASELDSRAQIAAQQYENAPQQYKDLWTSYFGTKGDAIAAILDPTISTQTIQNEAAQVSIGGAAAMQGLNVSQSRAQELQQAGVTANQAQQGYAQIAYELPTDKSIASRFGQNFGQAQAENAVLLNNGQASRERQTLYADEKGLFNSRPGVDNSTLSQVQNY